MKEWTNIVREADYFNLLVSNSLELDCDLSFDVGSRGGNIIVQYETVRVINDGRGMDNPPTHIAVSDAQCHATRSSSLQNITPHAEDPAPAQRAGNIAFIWSEKSTKTSRVTPYREDGFPAVVIAVGLSKHYDHGTLHRKSHHPAIKAEYLAALWYNKPGQRYRGNGPSSITFDNYKEFWVDGEFKGHRWTDYNMVWNHRVLDTPPDEDTLGDFLGNLKGTTNMFTESFFNNAEDEVCYMADFA